MELVKNNFYRLKNDYVLNKGSFEDFIFSKNVSFGKIYRACDKNTIVGNISEYYVKEEYINFFEKINISKEYSLKKLLDNNSKVSVKIDVKKESIFVTVIYCGTCFSLMSSSVCKNFDEIEEEIITLYKNICKSYHEYKFKQGWI